MDEFKALVDSKSVKKSGVVHLQALHLAISGLEAKIANMENVIKNKDMETKAIVGLVAMFKDKPQLAAAIAAQILNEDACVNFQEMEEPANATDDEEDTDDEPITMDIFNQVPPIAATSAASNPSSSRKRTAPLVWNTTPQETPAKLRVVPAPQINQDFEAVEIKLPDKSASATKRGRLILSIGGPENLFEAHRSLLLKSNGGAAHVLQIMKIDAKAPSYTDLAGEGLTGLPLMDKIRGALRLSAAMNSNSELETRAGALALVLSTVPQFLAL